MKIMVCLKPILDPDTVEIDLKTEKIKRKLWMINPADLCALEEGIRIRGKFSGEVIAVSLAPPQEGDDVLRKALLYGADRSIRIWEESFAEVDAWVKSSILKKAVEMLGVDLIICGNRSKDTSSEFIGVALAERLNLPFISRVIAYELKDGCEFIAHKKLDRGGREAYSCRLPAVIAVAEGINQPRYIALFSRSYREGFKKKIELLKPEMRKEEFSPLTKLIRVGQSKPRTKAGKNMSGLSIADMMKVLRGETGGKKEIFYGSTKETVKNILEKTKEWIS